MDFQFDVTADGKIVKLLNVTDEHTREALVITVARTIDADATVAVLDTSSTSVAPARSSSAATTGLS